MTGDNAVLTKIAGPGTPDSYGDVDGDGPTLWEGRASGYLKRTRRTIVSAGQQVNLRRDVFTILDSAGAPVLAQAGPDWEGTTVTVEDRRTTPARTRTFKVKDMEHRQGGPLTSSVRLELDQEK